MKLKILAPVLTNFEIVTRMLIDEPGFCKVFWQNVEKSKFDLIEHLNEAVVGDATLEDIYFTHATSTEAYNRYQSLDKHALERPLHILEVQLGKVGLVEDLNTWDLDILAIDLESVTWRIYDHGIGLIEIDLNLNDQLEHISKHEIPATLNKLQKSVVNWGEKVAQKHSDMLLSVIFEWLYRQKNADKIFADPLTSDDPTVIGRPLWITRTLVFEPSDKKHRKNIIEYWLKDSLWLKRDSDEDAQKNTLLLEKIINDDSQHLTRWLNYIFRESSYPVIKESHFEQVGLKIPLCDAWEALLYAQYFYAAMEVVDLHLTKIYSRSFSTNRNLKLDSLKTLLEKNIQNANLLIMQFHDNAKYYTREVSEELNKILEYWDYDRVLVEPVLQKIRLCQERVNELHEKESARSKVFTEMILMVFTIASILGLSLNIVRYGRSMAQDANLASYDINTTNFVGWVASLPTDIVLGITIVFTVLVVVFYFYFRMRQTI